MDGGTTRIAAVSTTSIGLEHEAAFTPEHAREILRDVPELPGVFALLGHHAGDQPYVTRGANLRRRMARLLDPPAPRGQGGEGTAVPALSKRLNLRERVARLAWSVTGSEFESLLRLHRTLAQVFGAEEAHRRLRLHTPFFVRLTREAAHPRLYVTNRLSQRASAELYGPFASRAAAERYCDAVLDLFKLRRCHELLVVSPEHPGCIYGEMKRCMAPCNLGCSAGEYAAEGRAVSQFLETRGESLLSSLSAERAAASEAMNFEQAAAVHTQWEKVKAVAGEADDLVTALLRLRAVVVQPAARAVVRSAQDAVAADSADDAKPDAVFVSEAQSDPEQAAVFLFRAGRLAGPERLSTRGVRAVREQTAVGSSLYAQPLMLQAVPLRDGSEIAGAATDRGDALQGEAAEGTRSESSTALPPLAEMPASGPEARSPHVVRADLSSSAGLDAVLPPEARATALLEELERESERTGGLGAAADLAATSDHLALLRRWYYRPGRQRTGEIFLPNPDGGWPLRRILNGAARAALGTPKAMAETDREGARTLKTKLLHAGREGVERTVPVLDASPHSRSEEAGLPVSAPAGFRSRRKPQQANP